MSNLLWEMRPGGTVSCTTFSGATDIGWVLFLAWWSIVRVSLLPLVASLLVHPHQEEVFGVVDLCSSPARAANTHSLPPPLSSPSLATSLNITPPSAYHKVRGTPLCSGME